jgi:hypothetical protein
MRRRTVETAVLAAVATKANARAEDSGAAARTSAHERHCWLCPAVRAVDHFPLLEEPAVAPNP